MLFVRFTLPCGFLLLTGCQAVLGLSDFEVGGAADAAGPRTAADGGSVSSVSPTKQMVDTAHGDAQNSPRTDAGVALTVSPVGGARAYPASSERPTATRKLAGAAGSAGSTVVNAGATEDDAGSGTGPDIDKELGSSGLRVSEILGYYAGDWGQMVLRKQGNEIWGAYEYRAGTIIGQVNEEGVFSGWWTQSPTRTDADAGEVEFRWSKLANTTIALDGRWRYGSDGDWLENWDIVRVTDRSAPSQLTDRFESTDDFKRHP